MEFIEEARLPQAGLSNNADYLPLSLGDLRQTSVQQRQIPLASYKAAQDPGAAPGHTSAPLLESPHRVDWHGRSSHIKGAIGLTLHLAMHQSIGRCAHEDGPGCHMLLQAHGQVSGCTHSRVEPVRFRPENASDD
jgi:hypothetical protein